MQKYKTFIRTSEYYMILLRWRSPFMSVNDVQEAKAKIGAWMKGRDLFTQEVDSEDNDFQLNGKTATQIGITILHPKNLFRSIIVISKIELHSKHKESLSQLPASEKADFIWNLKKDLIFAPASFVMEPNGDNLESIQFSTEISFDELTDGKLIEAVDNVCRPLIWTAWIFLRKFGLPAEKVY